MMGLIKYLYILPLISLFVTTILISCHEDSSIQKCRLVTYHSKGVHTNGQHVKIQFIYNGNLIKKHLIEYCRDPNCLNIYKVSEYTYKYVDNQIVDVTLTENDTLIGKAFIFENNQLIKLDHGMLLGTNSYDLFFYDDQGYEIRREIWRNGMLIRLYIPAYRNGNFYNSITYDRLFVGRDSNDSSFTLTRLSWADHDNKTNPLKGCLPLYDIYGTAAPYRNENNMYHHEAFYYDENGNQVGIIGSSYLYDYNELGYPVTVRFVNSDGIEESGEFYYECF